MAAFPTWALWLPVRNRTAGVRKPTRGLVMHVQCGRGSLRRFFDNLLNRASSTWWISKTGVLENYVNPETDRAWAQADGNFDYHSAEFEGSPSEPLTAAQIETGARLYAAGHKRWGWPLQLANAVGVGGFGWHGMGGRAWGNHPRCPGPIRLAQRPAILARARAIAYPPIVVQPHHTSPAILPGHRTIRFGDHGPDVVYLQRFLGITADGDFGPRTFANVKRYQGDRSIKPIDGICGPTTWANVLAVK